MKQLRLKSHVWQQWALISQINSLEAQHTYIRKTGLLRERGWQGLITIFVHYFTTAEHLSVLPKFCAQKYLIHKELVRNGLFQPVSL